VFFTGAGMIHAVLLIMQPDGPDHILSPLRSASERASAVSQRPTLVMNSDVSCMFPVQAGDAHAHCVYMCEVCMYHGSQNRAPEQVTVNAGSGAEAEGLQASALCKVGGGHCQRTTVTPSVPAPCYNRISLVLCVHTPSHTKRFRVYTHTPPC
jgi:hypothetical protein